ncbi:MAG TPA: hypothetical protein VK400_00845 [Pyrinomonadaceae bacterium]|nr:hypothetical protein [Pyrinomonadaceae bacterium]
MANTFEGTSGNGNFQEALDQAVQSAFASSTTEDERLTWKLESVSGEYGSIAGINKLTVTIYGELDSERKGK